MINRIEKNIWQLCFKEFGSCVYFLKSNNKNILIDTSSKEASQELIMDLEKLNIKPKDINTILLTHTHPDHNANISLFPNAQVIPPESVESSFPELKLIQTPGHTPDSVCYLYKEVLFSGDTIFDKEHNYIGRTDFPESNPEAMQESLNKLRKLKYTKLCPGHLV